MKQKRHNIRLYMKAAIRIILITLVIIIIVSCSSCSRGRGAWGIDSQYLTGEELEEMFRTNKEQFDKVARIVLGSDAFTKKIEEEGDGDAQITSQWHGRYFTEEEWKEIESLVSSVKLYSIQRYGSRVVAFYYPMNKEKQSSDLYYFVNGDGEDSAYAGWYDKFTQLDDHWWLGEETNGIVMN